MLRLGFRFIAVLTMLTVASAAQCATSCSISGCHHGASHGESPAGSMGSMPQSHQAMTHQAMTHQAMTHQAQSHRAMTHQPGHHHHPSSGPTEPMQQDENCSGRPCGDHATYLAKAKDISAFQKVAMVSTFPVLPVAVAFPQFDTNCLQINQAATHSPPYPLDVGAFTAVLRI